MTQLADLWKLLPFLGLLVVIAAVAIVIVRSRRSRAVNSAAAVAPEPSLSEADAAFLDSSHIGLEPFLGAKNLPPYGADAAMNGSDPRRAPR